MTEVDMMFQIAARRIQGLTAKVNHWKQRADKLEADLGVEKAARLVPPTHYDEIPEMEKQRDGLMAQVQDMRKEIARLRADLRTMSERSNGSEWEQKAVELEELRAELNSVKQERDCAKDEWDRTEERCKTLVGEVAELFSDRQRLKAELAVIKDERNELRIKLEASEAESRGYYEELSRIRRKTAPCEPNTPTPRSHPVKVGEWVKRTYEEASEEDSRFKIGAVALVIKATSSAYVVDFCGVEATWMFVNCAPCDPPESTEAAANAVEEQAAADIKVGDYVEVFRSTDANWTRADEVGIKGTIQRIEIQREPQPGDVVRLVRFPTPKECREWSDEFGKIGELATVISDDDEPCPFCVSVVRSEGCMDWPLSCIEIVDAK